METTHLLWREVRFLNASHTFCNIHDLASIFRPKTFYFKLFSFFFFNFPIAICPASLVRQQFHGPKASYGGNRIYVTIYIEFPSCCTSCHIWMTLGLQHPCEIRTYWFSFIIDWETKTLSNKTSVNHRAKSRSQLSQNWTCIGYCKAVFLPSGWCYFSDKKIQGTIMLISDGSQKCRTGCTRGHPFMVVSTTSCMYFGECNIADKFDIQTFCRNLCGNFEIFTTGLY